MEHDARNTFTAWLDEMEIDKERAAVLLGRTVRCVEYYEAGRPVPLSIMYLMDALAEGYRPPLRRRA